MSALGEIFEFTDDDLRANRSGVLSPRQVALYGSYMPRMRVLMGWRATIPTLIVLGIVYVLVAYYVVSSMGNAFTPQQMPLVVGGITLLFLLGFFLISRTRVRQIFALNRMRANLNGAAGIEAVTGRVTVTGGFAGPNNYQGLGFALMDFHVGKRRFLVPVAQKAEMATCFARDRVYTIYLMDAPACPWLVSAEEAVQ